MLYVPFDPSAWTIPDVSPFLFSNAPRARSSALPSPFASLSVDPLANSTASQGGAYDDVDPWSSAPSPSASAGASAIGSAGTREERRPALRTAVSTGVNGDLIRGSLGVARSPHRSTDAQSPRSAAEEHVPTAYLNLYDALDIERSGDISVTALHRLLSTAEVAPSIIERVVNIVSPSAKTVSRQQFFVALGLVALAQQGVGG